MLLILFCLISSNLFSGDIESFKDIKQLNATNFHSKFNQEFQQKCVALYQENPRALNRTLATVIDKIEREKDEYPDYQSCIYKYKCDRGDFIIGTYLGISLLGAAFCSLGLIANPNIWTYTVILPLTFTQLLACSASFTPTCYIYYKKSRFKTMISKINSLKQTLNNSQSPV